MDPQHPPDARAHPGARWARRALLAGVVALAVLGVAHAFATSIVPAATNLRFGFPSYYTSSRLALTGAWTPEVYDDRWFAERTLELTDGEIREVYRPNTPVMSLLALPVAGLDVMTARRAWLAVDLAFVAVAIAALLAALPTLRRPLRAALLVALAAWWFPLRETVGLGQAYALMLALQAVALWALARGRDGAAGMSLGVAAAAKLAALPVLLVLAVRAAWRPVVVALATAAALAFATLWFAGSDGWSTFARAVVADVVQPPAFLSVTAYQSTTGLLGHLFTLDPAWNREPIAVLPWVASLGAAAATLVVIAVTAWLGRTGRVELAIGTAVAAGLLVLNLAQEYHFAMLLVPAAVALAAFLDGPRRTVLSAAWLGLALVVAGAPLPYEDPGLAAGWLALAAYPRLYGTILLWAWLVRALWRERRVVPDSATASPTATMAADPAVPGTSQRGDPGWPGNSSSN